MRYAFGEFEIDEELFELRRDGARVPLRPQALDVLLLLVRAKGRVVSKAEIGIAVWGGARVSDTALPQAIAAVRRALEDDADEPSMVQTARGRGYRFAPEVIAFGSAAAPAGAPSSRGAQPFVGREAFVARVRELLARAVAGRGQVALVAGDPGAGKTRALAEIAALARAAGARVLSARCEEEGAPDLWPWVQLLRALAADDAPARAAVARMFPAGAPEDAAAGDGRFRLFDAATQTLAAGARGAPLVLAIDDLHWADPSSLLLFKHATQALAESRVLLAATYRDASLATNAVLSRTLGALTREDPARVMALKGLAAADVATLARAILGREPEPALVDRVFAKTAGNALFVTQLLHVIRSEQWLAPLGEGATSAMLDVEEVRRAVGLHLDELSPECRRVLSAASVLGTTFALLAVAPLVSLEPPHALAVLDEAQRAKVVAKADAPATYRFLHTLVRDVLYKALTGADRVRLHEAAARALAAQGMDDDARAHRAKTAALVGSPVK